MNATEYSEKALRTASEEFRNSDYAHIGLFGEAGEVIEEIKKSLFHGHELNTTRVLSELGDLCWYINLLCDIRGDDFNRCVKFAFALQTLDKNLPKNKAGYV